MFGPKSKPLTTEERYNVRMGFVMAGFVRVSATFDEEGKGAYSETWVLGKNQIVISWEEKAKPEGMSDEDFRTLNNLTAEPEED